MIVYRLQQFPDTDAWCNEYFATQAEGKAALRKCDDIRARLDKVDVPTDKAGLVAFLNVRDANHMNQPCELVARNY